MSTISASTTSTTAYKVTADTTGTLVFQTGATPTTAMTLGSDQSVTFAGTPTYSGGTANGVAYLNGSKVFTTGSALVFDGTNLGIGTTTPQALLDVGLGSQTYNPTYKGAVRLNATTNPPTTNSGGIEFLASGYQSGFGYRIASCDEGGGSTPLTFLYRSNSAAWTEGMRLTNAGNLLIGTTTQSLSGKLTVKGTNSTFTSDGLSSSAQLNIQAHNGAGYDPKIYLECPGVQGAGMYLNRATGQLRLWSTSDAAGVSLAGGGTSWGSFSDERLKDIIEPIENALEKVATLRTVIGRYKIDDVDKRRVFLIAQDVQAVLPEAVYQNSDEDDTLSLAYTETIPLLVAAIKELKAELDAAKADIETLKGAA